MSITITRRVHLLVLAFGLVASAAPAQAADAPYTCGTGVLRDVEVVTRLVPTGQFTYIRREPRRRGRDDLHGYITPGERQDKRYRVTVDVNDLSYTVESSGNALWDFDPTRLVINDEIGVCVDGKRLILRRPDGKNYTASIVRVVRGTQP